MKIISGEVAEPPGYILDCLAIILYMAAKIFEIILCILGTRNVSDCDAFSIA
jgi:hypothetical protein